MDNFVSAISSFAPVQKIQRKVKRQRTPDFARTQ
jgi:hypothetical protein